MHFLFFASLSRSLVSKKALQGNPEKAFFLSYPTEASLFYQVQAKALCSKVFCSLQQTLPVKVTEVWKSRFCLHTIDAVEDHIVHLTVGCYCFHAYNFIPA